MIIVKNFSDEGSCVTVSIVSHGHGIMVESLIRVLLGYSEVGQIILTCNIPETLNIASHERITLVDNGVPKGFGSNHNAAFALCQYPFFCPLNPDIELSENPFPKLLKSASETGAALVAPLIFSRNGSVEDSIRHFPTFRLLLSKVLGNSCGRYPVFLGQPDFYPEWVAGMFLMFRSQAFACLHGFDEKFFLYYEDVDICVRAWKNGMKVLACPSVAVVHDARRESHRSSRYLRWHLASMVRYFWKHWLRLPKPDMGR
ncbi:MAG: hypothetical protein RLZZ298_535 [Pseudomonadota bacterium]